MGFLLKEFEVRLGWYKAGLNFSCINTYILTCTAMQTSFLDRTTPHATAQKARAKQKRTHDVGTSITTNILVGLTLAYFHRSYSIQRYTYM